MDSEKVTGTIDFERSFDGLTFEEAHKALNEMESTAKEQYPTYISATLDYYENDEFDLKVIYKKTKAAIEKELAMQVLKQEEAKLFQVSVDKRELRRILRNSPHLIKEVQEEIAK